MDTHPIHFHLFNVQVINRVGWDGADPAARCQRAGLEGNRADEPAGGHASWRCGRTAPKAPFGVPDSIRLLDPTMPQGSTMGFFNVDPEREPGHRVTNEPYNFGWEYVWHCHILSHEEMDMMRPMQFNVARQPAAHRRC